MIEKGLLGLSVEISGIASLAVREKRQGLIVCVYCSAIEHYAKIIVMCTENKLHHANLSNITIIE